MHSRVFYEDDYESASRIASYYLLLSMFNSDIFKVVKFFDALISLQRAMVAILSVSMFSSISRYVKLPYLALGCKLLSKISIPSESIEALLTERCFSVSYELK